MNKLTSAEAFAMTVRESHGWTPESITDEECCEVERSAWLSWARAWAAAQKSHDAEIELLRQDAERYRFLVSANWFDDAIMSELGIIDGLGDTVDAAIDAAIADLVGAFKVVRQDHAQALLDEKDADIEFLRSALESLLESVTNSGCGEVDRKLAVKDARIAIAQTAPVYNTFTFKLENTMTLNITAEIIKEYEVYLNEAEDYDVHGGPILRRHCYPHNVANDTGLVTFAAGFQAARLAALAADVRAAELLLAFKDAPFVQAQGCMGGVKAA
jgi:hypothetical protein